MITKRIIPCLDVNNGRTVKGTRFVDIRDIGDPAELAAYYSDRGADELVFLDITASHEKRKTLPRLVRRVAENVSIPFTVGGGVKEIQDAEILLDAGADKLSVNSAAVNNPSLINEIAERYGSQFVTLAVDAKWMGNRWEVFINGGRINTGKDLFEWTREAESRGCGEILFTSMDHDGVKTGYATEPLAQLSAELNVPVIASGGAGNEVHFVQLFQQTRVDAALAASVFHVKQIEIENLKKYLQGYGIPVRI